MPMVELLSAFGARLQSGPLFCFWIRYEAPTAERGSSGAPLLCQPTAVSTMPKIVMPCQVSWQLMVKKSAGSVQARSVEEFAVVGEAFVGTASAARASAAPKRAAPARKAAQNPNFAILKFRKGNTTSRLPRPRFAPQAHRFVWRCGRRRISVLLRQRHTGSGNSVSLAPEPLRAKLSLSA